MDFDQTIGKSFNIDFCQRLEHHLSHTFRIAGIGEFKYFWCDGVEIPQNANQRSIDFMELRQIITWTSLGPTGQDNYQMIIRLGNNSFKRCIKGQDIYDCLPDDQSLDWVDIDPLNKSIILRFVISADQTANSQLTTAN